MRSEQDRPNSEYGGLIRNYIKEGKIVPMEITVRLLETAIRETLEKFKGSKEAANYNVFLIDGFPRKLDQAQMFEEKVSFSLRVKFDLNVIAPFLGLCGIAGP